MTRRDALLRTPALLLGLALPVAAQSQSTFYAAYEDGLALQAKGKHAAALAAFQRAAELRPKPGTRILTYGMNFLEAYHPWLKIAQCALAVKDLDTAEEALKRSAQFNAEPAAERQALQQRLQVLRTPAPAPAAPVQAPPPAPVPAPALQGPAPAPVQVQPGPIPVPAAAQPAGKAPTGPAPTPADPRKGAGTVAAVPATGVSPPVQSSPSPAPPTAAGTGTAPASPQAPAPGTPAPWGRWLFFGLGGVVLGGIGVWASRRRRPTAPPLSADHIATVRIQDQDGTQLLASKPRATQPGGPAPQQTQQGQMRMGGYTLQKVLGKGACGITYMGIRDENGLEVAIKVPHPHMLEDSEFLARFHQEAALGARLVHDKIVRIIDPGPTEGTPWLAMELVRGVTLDQHLKERGRLDLKEVLAITLDIAEAVAYAHAQGVVHRDLKPSNVMVGEKGAQVLDFGIARLTDGVGMTATQVFIGTPLYASPESIVHSRVGPGADRYALGIMLFEFLTGRPPFVGPTTFATLQMHQTEPLPDLAALVPGLDPRLVRLVTRLTEKKAEHRPEDGEVLTLLRQLLAAS